MWLSRARHYLGITTGTDDAGASGEPAQAILRFILVLPSTLYAVWVLGWAENAPVRFALASRDVVGFASHPVIQALIAYFLVGLALLVHSWNYPDYRPRRRVVAYLADYGLLTFVLVMGGTAFAPFVILLLWVTVGNGMRCGERELQISMIAALTSLLVVGAFNTEWLHRPYFFGTIFGLTTLMPAYFWYLMQLLVSAKHRARDANAAKSRFLANMSHEFRTPLHSILSLAEMMAARKLPPDLREYVEAIGSSARGLSELVQDVLDFSAIEAGKLTTRMQVFVVETLVNDVVATIRPTAVMKGLTIRVSIMDTVPKAVFGAGDHARRALLNIVNNAAKFTDQGEIHIEVDVERAVSGKAKLLFSVTDTGPGIPAEVGARLFEPFYLVDDGLARRSHGTGLGTSIARQLVELNQGQIGYESGVLRGTRFWFTFAVTDVPEGMGADASPPEARPASSVLAARSMRVVVVDDHGPNRFVAAAMLRSAGHVPVCVENGKAAVELLNEDWPDVMLLDLHMPDMDGLDVTRWIRDKEAQEGRPPLPVLLLTADNTPGARDAATRAGVTAILTKPIGMKMLDAVNAFCHRPEEEVVETVVAGASTAWDDGHLREIRDALDDDVAFTTYVNASIKDSRKCIEQLRHALSAGDRGALAEGAHGLKGLTSGLGFVEVAAQCALLEQESMHGTQTDAVRHRIVGIESRFDASVAHLVATLGIAVTG